MDLWSANWLAQANISLDVALALFLGGLIGLERELADRPAGFRTQPRDRDHVARAAGDARL